MKYFRFYNLIKREIIFVLLLTFLSLFYSCKDASKVKEDKIKNQIIQYIEDDNFKRNLKIEILDSKVTYLTQIGYDTIWPQMGMRKAFNIGFLLGGYEEYQDWSNSGLMWDDIEKAQSTDEFIKYKSEWQKYKGENICLVKFYLKAIQMNFDGKNKKALLIDNDVFLLETNQFKVIDFMKESSYNSMLKEINHSIN